MTSGRLPREAYRVGWICALPIELVAAQEMLDVEHGSISENNVIYHLGQMAEHNVVVACLSSGRTGTVSAAVMAQKMMTAFTQIQLKFLVGVGGGVPTKANDVRLGDVVISKPQDGHGGVVKIDSGKATPTGFQSNGHLDKPQAALLNAVSSLQAQHMRGRAALFMFLGKNKVPDFEKAAAGPDVLFETQYNHEGDTDCSHCDAERIVKRCPENRNIKVHYGTIASSDTLMRDGTQRDEVSKVFGGILCFEMEAAGLMDDFSCLVVRGICDYADSHKNKKWQPYAAGTAAACAKEILSVIPVEEVPSDPQISKRHEQFMTLLYEGGCDYNQTRLRNHTRVLGTSGPGCGKSVLSRHLIDDILPSNKTVVCYFFFKDDFVDQKAPSRTMCSLLHQLFLANPYLVTAEMLKRQATKGSNFFKSFPDLWNLFEKATNHQNVVCVVDALDECRDQDREQFTSAVKALCTELPEKEHDHRGVKFILTSRPHGSITRLFRLSLGGSIRTIHIQGEHGDTSDEIAREIKLVLDSRIDGIAKALPLDQDRTHLLRTRLHSVPNRTYLWITLIFDGILKRNPGLTSRDIIKITERPPQTIFDAYERMLKKVEDDNAESARRLLHIIVGAARPLSLQEVSLVLALGEGSSTSSITDSLVSLDPREVRDYLINLCGLLVDVVDEKVYLLHQTAREFLVNNPEILAESGNNVHKSITTQVYTWRHSILLEEAESIIATACIVYLFASLDTQFPTLHEYAVKHWPRHYRQSPKRCQRDLADKAKEVCKLSEKPTTPFSHWKEAKERIPESTRHLFLATAEGLAPVVRAILSKDFRLEVGSKSQRPHKWSDIEYKQRGNALLKTLGQERCYAVKLAWFAAAAEGHITITKLLLDVNVDINCTGNLSYIHGFRTALSYAVEEGHLRLVKLLLENNASIAAPCSSHSTPIMLAAARGRMQVLELLLRDKASHATINSLGPDNNTPLLRVAGQGYDDVARLLLSTGAANINLANTEGETAVHRAARGGHEGMVRLLLETGEVAEIDSQDKHGHSALSIAVESGYTKIAELLRSHNAIVDTYQRTKSVKFVSGGGENIQGQ
ncbi:hypothetical protein AK830_g11997 [Neonectria ditissima]|uniref:Uncharacterized protein n=1 Tax=Neonectria ditissima TaxID=78410 RepID=A0A0P7B1L3_9HYPO|nr:hypothetical protein AK830_g11997 [Neonectria ditissima]